MASKYDEWLREWILSVEREVSIEEAKLRKSEPSLKARKKS